MVLPPSQPDPQLSDMDMVWAVHTACGLCFGIGLLSSLLRALLFPTFSTPVTDIAFLFALLWTQFPCLHPSYRTRSALNVWTPTNII